MEKRKAITSSQLFVMLFVSCMVVSMTYGNMFVGSSELWDHIISALMALFATWLILVPIYRLFLIDEKGKKYQLIFDCKNCEMIIKEA